MYTDTFQRLHLAGRVAAFAIAYVVAFLVCFAGGPCADVAQYRRRSSFCHLHLPPGALFSDAGEWAGERDTVRAKELNQ